MDEGILASIRSVWQTGTSLGNERFKEKIEKTLKMKATLRFMAQVICAVKCR
jgi:hypothetical protein